MSLDVNSYFFFCLEFFPGSSSYIGVFGKLYEVNAYILVIHFAELVCVLKYVSSQSTVEKYAVK